MKDYWCGLFQTVGNWHSLAFDSHENRTEIRTYACSLFDHPQRYLRFLEVLWDEFFVDSEDHLNVHMSELLRDVPRIGSGCELAAGPSVACLEGVSVAYTGPDAQRLPQGFANLGVGAPGLVSTRHLLKSFEFLICLKIRTFQTL